MPVSWPKIAHVVLYGQSLSCGFGGLPALSTDPAPIGLRFSGGVRPIDDLAEGYGSLVPLAERNWGHFGETPATAAARMFAQLLLAEDGIAAADAPFRLLMSASGEPGKAVAELSVGTANFDRVKADVISGLICAHAQGVDYRLMAMAWIQGETDYAAATTRDAYLAAFRRLHEDLRQMARGMDPLATGFPLLLAQTTTHVLLNRSVPDIALAQLELADADDAALVCAPYALPFWPNDLHMMPLGYQWLGAYYGLALKRWLWDGAKPRHLRAIEARVVDGGIDVRFATAGAPLAFDTQQVAAMPAMGFTLAAADGEEIAIAGVRLVGDDMVRLEVGELPAAPLSVRYGWRGAAQSGAGNLRDTAGDALRFDGGGYSLPLHNWCPILEIAVRA